MVREVNRVLKIQNSELEYTLDSSGTGYEVSLKINDINNKFIGYDGHYYIDGVSFSYAEHDNSYYKGPKITINYTSKLESVTKSADTYIAREFISSSDVCFLFALCTYLYWA